MRSRNYGCFEVTLYELDFVVGRKSNPEPEVSQSEKDCVAQSNKYEEQKTQDRQLFQQQLILAKKTLRSIGINYREESVWWEITAHGLDKIYATVDYFKFKMAKIPNCIYNPSGWFRAALNRNFHLDFDPPYSIFDSLSDLFSTSRRE